MAAANIDYAASYFKFKKATPIQGTPTNKALKLNVETDLGGGDHGYLGPFIAPGFPANLTIPSHATQVEAMELRENHKEVKHLY